MGSAIPLIIQGALFGHVLAKAGMMATDNPDFWLYAIGNSTVIVWYGIMKRNER